MRRVTICRDARLVSSGKASVVSKVTASSLYQLLQRCGFDGDGRTDRASLQESSRCVPTTSRFLWNYFGISSVDIFYFPGRKGKILRTYRLILPKYRLILPRKFFLPTWRIENIHRGESKISTEASRRPSCVTDLLAVERLCVEAVFDQNSIG